MRFSVLNFYLLLHIETNVLRKLIYRRILFINSIELKQLFFQKKIITFVTRILIKLSQVNTKDIFQYICSFSPGRMWNRYSIRNWKTFKCSLSSYSIWSFTRLYSNVTGQSFVDETAFVEQNIKSDIFYQFFFLYLSKNYVIILFF